MVTGAQWQRETAYDRFMKEEGIPVLRGYGVPQIRALDLKPWKRLGGKGAFVNLVGQEYQVGAYVVEIPPRGALNIEQHLYEEQFLVFEGSGSTEVWTFDGKRQSFGWTKGSIFGVPLNAKHRLVNEGDSPVLAVATTTAPLVMDVFHEPTFIFDNPYRFTSRYDGRPDYFTVKELPASVAREGAAPMVFMDSNVIADARSLLFQDRFSKGGNYRVIAYSVVDNVLTGHVAKWPGGQYVKAHAHGAGAVLMPQQGRGYSLMWPPVAGVRPYESGNGQRVVKVEWENGAMFSPATAWWHQHLVVSQEPIVVVAMRYGDPKNSVGFWASAGGEGSGGNSMVSMREGGTMIDFDMEDPQIRKDYKAVLAAAGTPWNMPSTD